jgi:hypothetical protein
MVRLSERTFTALDSFFKDIEKKPKYIYIASAYTKGDQAVNVRRSLMAANELLRRGYIPHVPPLYHFWQLISPKTYEEWLMLDRAWLDKCDAVLRLEGESKWADEECEYALNRGLHVYYSIDRIGHGSTK